MVSVTYGFDRVGGGGTDHPAQAGRVGADCRNDLQRRAFTGPQLERELTRSSIVGQPRDVVEKARAVLADEHAHGLTDEESLADIEELRGGTIDFGDHRGG